MGKPRLLLIDGNNMAHRVFWVNKELSHKGQQINLVYGFMKQLVGLHKKWPEHFRVIAWDGGHKRRTEESERGVEEGIIPSAYKATRKRGSRDDMQPQLEILRKGLELTRSMQVFVEGYEADDLINSYVHYARRWGGESIVVSSDKDFYQVLGEGTVVYDAMNDDMWDEKSFRAKYGFGPELWVDAGAIEGEVGESKDNIHGVTGWGPKTTLKYVLAHGGIENIRKHLAGLDKLKKLEQEFLNSEKKLDLARSLKSMDIVPQGVKRPRMVRSIGRDGLMNWMSGLGFKSLLGDSWRLV